MAKEINIQEARQKAEAIAQVGLQAGETLLGYSTLQGRTGKAVFNLVLGFLLVLIGIGGSLSGGYDVVGGVIFFVIFGALGALCIRSGLNARRESKFKHCFITDKRLCFRGDAGKMRDVSKEEIQKVQFIPKGTIVRSGKRRRLTAFDQIVYKTKKKNVFRPDFDGEKIAAALQEISRPFQTV